MWTVHRRVILQQAVRTAMRGTMPADVAAERQLNVIERLLALMPRSRGFQVKANASISVYPASSRARLPAAKQKSYPKPPKRDSRSEQAGSKRAANARTRRSAARAAKHAERREQAELRLQQLACKMAKVLRWRHAQDIWTAWMRDRTASATAPSLAQPAAPAPAPAAPPPPAPSSPDVRMCSPSGSAEKRMHHTPDSRASQTPATPPSAPKMKRRKPGAVAAALAAAATPQAHTATSEAAPDRRAASPRSPTPPPPPPTSPPSASWPALPTRTSLGPETNIPAWGCECRPPQG